MEVMSLLLERSPLFPMLQISTFSEKVCYQLSFLSVFGLLPSHIFCSSTSKHVLVTPFLKTSHFWTPHFLCGPTFSLSSHSHPNCKCCIVIIGPNSTPAYSLASCKAFLPYFFIKTIFIKVSSDLHASKSQGHSLVFILCDFSVDFNKADPSFF